MTPEQAKQLKKGDKILVEAEFDEIDAAGNVEFRYPYRAGNGEIHWSGDGVLPERVSLPPEKPKYDPCRLFKKGDIVEPRKVDGRFDSELIGCYRYVVLTDESSLCDSIVRIKPITSENELITNTIYLELVTPVEELEPYFIFEDTYSWQVKRENKLCCRFGKSTHPHAKEAAEAESARLNEENRKKKLQKEIEQESAEC